MSGVVGSVEITGCVESSTSRWFQGRYGFQMRNASPCELYPLRGQLGFFPVPFNV
jgi:hypothetical protein